MLEKDFNNLIVKSLNTQGGFGFKIGDQGSTITGYHQKNPYDLFGYYRGRFVCCESKWLKKPAAFNLNRLEDHQIANLIKAYEMVDNCIALFMIGIDFGRNDKRVFIWKNDDLYKIKERKNNKDNIYKKEFESLTNFIKIEKNSINFDSILNTDYEV